MVNYYVELGLDRGSDAETLKEQLGKLRKKWQGRAGSAANLEVRQEAERKIQLIREASAILLVESEREKYDKELDENPTTANQSSAQQDEGADVPTNTVMDDAAAMDAIPKAYNEGKYNTVFALADGLIKKGKANDYIYRLVALSYFESGNDAKAIQTLDDMVAALPDNPDARYYSAFLDLIFFPKRADVARKNVDWLLQSEEGASARVAALDVSYYIVIEDMELAAALTEKYKQQYGKNEEFTKRVGDAYTLYAESKLTTYGGDAYFDDKESYKAWNQYTQMSISVSPNKVKQERYAEAKKRWGGIKLMKDNLFGVLMGAILAAFLLYSEIPTLGIIFIVATVYTAAFSFPPKWMYHRSLYTGHLKLPWEIAKWVSTAIGFAFRALIWLIKLIFQFMRLIIEAFC